MVEVCKYGMWLQLLITRTRKCRFMSRIRSSMAFWEFCAFEPRGNALISERFLVGSGVECKRNHSMSNICSLGFNSGDLYGHSMWSQYLRRQRSMTPHQFDFDLSESTGKALSQQAVHRRLHACQLYARILAICIPLKVSHRKKSLTYSRRAYIKEYFFFYHW